MKKLICSFIFLFILSLLTPLTSSASSFAHFKQNFRIRNLPSGYSIIVTPNYISFSSEDNTILHSIHWDKENAKPLHQLTYQEKQDFLKEFENSVDPSYLVLLNAYYKEVNDQTGLQAIGYLKNNGWSHAITFIVYDDTTYTIRTRLSIQEYPEGVAQIHNNFIQQLYFHNYPNSLK